MSSSPLLSQCWLSSYPLLHMKGGNKRIKGKVPFPFGIVKPRLIEEI